jgi:hypothetical protein
MGITISNELSAAIDLFDALKHVEVGRRPVLSLEGVTPETAEEKVREFARQLEPTAFADYGDGIRLTTLERSKKRCVEAAAYEVLLLATAEVPSAIEQLTPQFNEVVDAYAEAVRKLPHNLTDKTLLIAGSEAVAAWSVAQSLAAQLDSFDRWSASLSDLKGVGGGSAAFNLRILRPKTKTQLGKLDGAKIDSQQADSTQSAVGHVWRAAVREGIEFGLNTPKEAAEIRKRLESQPESKPRAA